MRVTDQGMLNDALNQVRRGQERLQATQHRATTGLMVERPSDDPVAFTAIDTQTDQLARLEGYSRNIDLVQSRLSATEASLQSTNGLLTRLRELTMMALNEVTVTPSVGVEAQQVYDELLRQTNASYTGDYLFGGYSGTPPFSGTRFVGDNAKRAVEVSPLGATVFGISAQEAFGVLPGQDVYQALSDTVQAIKTGNRAGIQAGLAAVDSQQQIVALSMARLGTQQNTLTVAQQANTAHAQVLTAAISKGRDIDPAQAYSQLTADRYALDATYAVLASRGQLSILKYL